MRLILFLLILYLLYRLTFRYLPTLVRFLLAGRSQKQKEEAHDMIPCSTCGTYMSKGLAFPKSGRYFCSEKCRLES